MTAIRDPLGVRGRGGRDPRARAGQGRGPLVAALVVVSLASLSLAAFSRPDAGLTVSPEGAAPPLLRATERQALADTADPEQLPAFPGAVVVAHDERVVDAVNWLRVEYLAQGALQDEVRRHYRSVLRDGPWRVQGVDYHDGVWTLSAVDDRREVRLDISVEEHAVRVAAIVSDEVPSATPAGGRAVGR